MAMGTEQSCAQRAQAAQLHRARCFPGAVAARRMRLSCPCHRPCPSLPGTRCPRCVLQDAAQAAHGQGLPGGAEPWVGGPCAHLGLHRQGREGTSSHLPMPAEGRGSPAPPRHALAAASTLACHPGVNTQPRGHSSAPLACHRGTAGVVGAHGHWQSPTLRAERVQPQEQHGVLGAARGPGTHSLWGDSSGSGDPHPHQGRLHGGAEGVGACVQTEPGRNGCCCWCPGGIQGCRRERSYGLYP